MNDSYPTIRVPTIRVEVRTDCESATQALAQIVGRELPAASVVALRGDLGAGKTAFARGLAEGLDVDPRQVSSPTFLYMVEHHGGRLPFVHADLYRLEDVPAAAREQAFESIGLINALEGDAVAAIEWWDWWTGPVPARCVVVEIASLPGDNRRITLEFSGPDLDRAAAAAADFASTPR
ncbi:MAG: tRNA threonylcarbamoyladenosine biosynthesis protein TsaE [Planctomycetota bacterium]|jgi:tRNA threonylcarbamoyladenosine biosynthesis protein TsaE